MLIIDRKAPADMPATEELRLPFDARCKTRLRTRLASGVACDLFLPRGTVMRHGDRLLARDGRVIAVVAAAEELLEARSADPLLLAKAAYHLGNRHVALAIAPGLLRFGHDHVLGEMVQGLGLAVQAVTAPFEPESGAYGGHAGGHAVGHAVGHSGGHAGGHAAEPAGDYAGGNAGGHASDHGVHGAHAHPLGHSADGEGRGPRIHDHYGHLSGNAPANDPANDPVDS